MTGQVLFVSHTHEAGVFKVGSHHLAREFALAGHEVMHVSSPFSLAHRLRDPARDEGSRWAASRQVRVDRFGVRHVVPTTLLPARFHTTGYLRRLLHEQGFAAPRFTFVDQPLMAHPALCRLGRTTVYRPTDTYTGQAGAMQRRLVRSVDGVAATSYEVLRRLALDVRTPAVVIENGVDFRHFACPPDPRPRDGVVYVGALDGRFCWDTVRALAEQERTEPFSIAGPLPPGGAPPIPPNVRLLGAVDYAEVPEILAAHRVGLLPLTAADENRGRSPMKLYEYLAAGLSVVARRNDGPLARPIPGVTTYDTLDDARTALRRALRDPVPNAAGIEAAAQQGWSGKMRELEAFALGVEAGKAAHV
jgi:teichuronic acid biosynthesis glycosyltransferase TuaH